MILMTLCSTSDILVLYHVAGFGGAQVFLPLVCKVMKGAMKLVYQNLFIKEQFSLGQKKLIYRFSSQILEYFGIGG